MSWLDGIRDRFLGVSRHVEIARESVVLDRERRKNARPQSETAFLPAALEILETPPNPIGRAILWVIMVFIVIAVAWASLGSVDEVAIASGKILPRGAVKLIQAPDYGIVRAIHVVDGQTVKKGAPLIELDPTVSTAEAEQARRSLLVALTDEMRAKALLAAFEDKPGGAAFTVPAGVNPADGATQHDLVDAKIREYKSAKDGLGNDLAQRRGELAMTDAEVVKLQDQLELAQSQLDAMNTLAAQGYAPRLKVMELEERVIGVRQDLAIRQAESLKLAAAIRSEQNQITHLGDQFKREALDALNEAEAAVALRSEELKKADEKSALTILTAPDDGVVQQLAVHTLGAVVKPADTLLVLVPKGVELVVEAMVLNRDAGFVREGDIVAVKLEAYPFTRYGVIPARLETISRDAIEDKERGLVYATRAKLLQSYIMVDGKPAPLAPGLAATVEIKTGERRIIDYLLSPLSRRIQEAGRER